MDEAVVAMLQAENAQLRRQVTTMQRSHELCVELQLENDALEEEREALGHENALVRERVAVLEAKCARLELAADDAVECGSDAAVRLALHGRHLVRRAVRELAGCDDRAAHAPVRATLRQLETVCCDLTDDSCESDAALLAATVAATPDDGAPPTNAKSPEREAALLRLTSAVLNQRMGAHRRAAVAALERAAARRLQSSYFTAWRVAAVCARRAPSIATSTATSTATAPRAASLADTTAASSDTVPVA